MSFLLFCYVLTFSKAKSKKKKKSQEYLFCDSYYTLFQRKKMPSVSNLLIF